MFPLSAPSSKSLFKGKSAIDVNTPLNASWRNFEKKNDEEFSNAECTPILFAVVPNINCWSYTDIQWIGSVTPLLI